MSRYLVRLPLEKEDGGGWVVELECADTIFPPIGGTAAILVGKTALLHQVEDIVSYLNADLGPVVVLKARHVADEDEASAIISFIQQGENERMALRSAKKVEG